MKVSRTTRVSELCPKTSRVINYILDKGDYASTPCGLAVNWLQAAIFEADIDEPAHMFRDDNGVMILLVRFGFSKEKRHHLIAQLLVSRAMRELECYKQSDISTLADELLENCSETDMHSFALTPHTSEFRSARG